jgi:hypothetical protein
MLLHLSKLTHNYLINIITKRISFFILEIKFQKEHTIFCCCLLSNTFFWAYYISLFYNLNKYKEISQSHFKVKEHRRLFIYINFIQFN